MIVYKTFSGHMNKDQDMLLQQNAVRNELVGFLNQAHAPHFRVIQVSEVAMPNSDVFSVTVWYSQPETKPDMDFSAEPKAQSADVLAQSLRDQNRRDVLTTMVDEHMIRSDSS